MKEIRRLKDEKCSEAAKWGIQKIEKKRKANKNELKKSPCNHTAQKYEKQNTQGDKEIIQE